MSRDSGPPHQDAFSGAAERVVAAISPRLYRYALVRLGRVDRAEDAVGETLCRLVDKGPPLDGDPAHVTGWCVRCMVNVCREFARERTAKSFSDRDTEHEDSALRFAEWHEGHTEESRMLTIALANISERQQEAVTLRVMMGLPVSAAAQAMECAEGTVKALTHQGLAALRKYFAENADRTGTLEL